MTGLFRTPVPETPVTIEPVQKTAPGLILGILVVAMLALYFGRDILLPLALAILLSFVLAPLALRLRRLRLGRVPSTVLSVMLAFSILLGIGKVVADQVVDLANNLQHYEFNILMKIRSLKQASSGEGIMDRATSIVRDITEELKSEDPSAQPAVPPPPRQQAGAGRGAPAAPAAQLPANGPEPVPVVIQQPQASPVELLRDLGGPVAAVLAQAGITVVFLIFIMLQREDLRDRVIRLAGTGDLRRTTEALNDAAKRVSRYLLMQLIVNVTYGLPIGIGLWLIGIPNPLLWGMLSTVLRFIPFLGPVIAAIFPIVLSFAVEPGWTLPLLTVALFLVVELISNNVVEPWLYGSSTGLSPLAIIVAAIFWTTLWGPVGLLLATPLTVCLVVLGRHVPQLRFIDVMLGDAPPLPAEARVYQRLLAADVIEAREVIETACEDCPTIQVYDEILLAGLKLAEQDRRRGALSRQVQHAVAEGALQVIDELAEEPAADLRGPSVLCIAARNELDRAAAAMLAQALAERGLLGEVLPCESVAPRAISALPRSGVSAICLSYLDPQASVHARRLARRLRGHYGASVPILVGFWGAQSDPALADDARRVLAADGWVSTLAEAVEWLVPRVVGDEPAEPHREAS
ncbi:AI-2E family transporter [Arenibaculum pallidiluteum]|uniref:AI-2E family transporter n=1 Tax=Arenibaculum pallidiluteum TaxID=2812559 RepID=UPI001F1D8D53|nr:AI-2E family transporter [Arenibaculum pallidiluteum]